MLSDEQKNTIADSLAIAIQDVVVRSAPSWDTHYKVMFNESGCLYIEYSSFDGPPDPGWIPLEGG